jgi:hypothetical protein
VLKSPPRSPKANAVCGASHRHDSARVPGLADPPVRIAFAVHSEILDSALQHRASGYGAGSGCSRSAASPSRSSNTAQFTPSLWRIVITNTSSRPPVRDSIFADHRHGTGMAGSGQVLFQGGRQVLADRGASRHSQFAMAIRVSLNNPRNTEHWRRTLRHDWCVSSSLGMQALGSRLLVRSDHHCVPGGVGVHREARR